jgi:hypothetical protein
MTDPSCGDHANLRLCDHLLQNQESARTPVGTEMTKTSRERSLALKRTRWLVVTRSDVFSILTPGGESHCKQANMSNL